MFPGGHDLAGTDGRRLQQVRGKAWTDITGMRADNGGTFAAEPGNSNAFLFSIPTPAYRSHGPASQGHIRLIEIVVLYRTDPGVIITRILATDGGRDFMSGPPEPINPIGIFPDPVPDPNHPIGPHGLNLSGNMLPSRFGGLPSDAQLQSLFVPGQTVFRLRPTRRPPPQDNPDVFFGVGIQVEVLWTQAGEITFGSAGAGFFDIDA
jgi:hypothetical protein